MANRMNPVVNSGTKASAPQDGLKTARGATTEPSSGARPADPEVVAIARRRQFSATEKRRIVAAADRCDKPGEIGALLRREGIYSSQLASWRKLRAAGGVTGLDTHKRGPKADPTIAEGHRLAKLSRENERLRRQLTQAHLIIDVQKKVSSLLALQAADDNADGQS